MTPAYEFVETLLQSAEAEQRWVTLAPHEIRAFAQHYYEKGLSEGQTEMEKDHGSHNQ